MNGWAVEILSDQLTVRAYSSSDAWTPGPMIVQPVVASNNSQPPSLLNLEAALTSIVSCDVWRLLRCEIHTYVFFLKIQPEAQRAQVGRLCQQTHLNVKFAVDCLQQNGWNHERAVANFEQVKVRMITSGLLRDASASCGALPGEFER
jgi:nuclear RNA export factor